MPNVLWLGRACPDTSFLLSILLLLALSHSRIHVSFFLNSSIYTSTLQRFITLISHQLEERHPLLLPTPSRGNFFCLTDKKAACSHHVGVTKMQWNIGWYVRKFTRVSYTKYIFFILNCVCADYNWLLCLAHSEDSSRGDVNSTTSWQQEKLFICCVCLGLCLASLGG